MAKTRAALAEEIRREVPFERLFAAMFHERAGGGEFLELNVSDPERMPDEFLQTCTVRQVRMLREIALELEEARLAPPFRTACGTRQRLDGSSATAAPRVLER